MRVGDVEDLEHALDRAVLAEGSVQRVEGDVGLELRKHLGDVALHVDARHAVAGLLRDCRRIRARNSG